MKKTIYLFIIGLFVNRLGLAQNFIPRQQYLYNPAVINPAFVGTLENANIWTNYGVHLLGIRNAPQNFTINAQSPLRKNHAMGTIFGSQSIGQNRNSTGLIQYSYSFSVNKNTSLIGGLNAGISNVRANFNSNPYLGSVTSYWSVNKLYTNLGLGFLLKNPKYFIGFSVPQIFQNKGDNFFRDTTNIGFYYPRANNFMAGLNFKILKNITVSPSLLATYHRIAPLNLEANLSILAFDRVKFISGIGLSAISFGNLYDQLSLGADVRIYKGLHLGYMFQRQFSNLNTTNYRNNQSQFFAHYEFLKKKVEK